MIVLHQDSVYLREDHMIAMGPDLVPNCRDDRVGAENAAPGTSRRSPLLDNTIGDNVVS